VIQLLGVECELVDVEGVGVEAPADWDQLRSPETYLGYQRAERSASQGDSAFDARRACAVPEQLPVNRWALAGEWTMGSEGVVRLRDGRPYQLVRQHDAVRERTLEITFLEPRCRGVRVHVSGRSCGGERMFDSMEAWVCRRSRRGWPWCAES